jgi:addiction module RelB/DinJ family antitoxin
MERSLKDEADKVFNALGMNLTTAITVFVRQAVRQRRIPFEISLDSTDGGRGAALAEAMAASERIWQASVRNGTDRMTMADIDTEIAAARKERRASLAEA